MSDDVKFSLSEIEAIADALGDTSEGLTGSEIGLLLANARIDDIAPGITKRKRLLNAFVDCQNRLGHRRNILAFIRFAMKPERYVRSPERFEPMRANLNRSLAFVALQVEQNGELVSSERSSTLPNAPFKKAAVSAAAEQAIGNVSALVFLPKPHKVFKRGPFDLSMVTPEHTYFSQLLVELVGKIKALPDFSDDKRIAVMTDFGGEHSAASFCTHSILFLAADKGGPFVAHVKALREEHQLLSPYNEFAYKRMKHGPRKRALPEYLELVDNLIHGAIITVAIDKRIETVFGQSKKDVHAEMVKVLADTQLGTWDGHAAEKALRVCHMLAAFDALLASGNQELFWYSDNDPINEDGKKRNFSDLQKMFSHVLGLYTEHIPKQVRFGKSFADKSFVDDLLNVPDLTAGVIQDLLQSHLAGAGGVFPVETSESPYSNGPRLLPDFCRRSRFKLCERMTVESVRVLSTLPQRKAVQRHECPGDRSSSTMP